MELAVEVEAPFSGIAVVLVQQLLPGSLIERVSVRLLDQLLRLADLQAGALAEHLEVPPIRLYLSEDGPGFCLHEPLRRHSSRTAALLSWVHTVSDDMAADVLDGTDAVHVDL